MKAWGALAGLVAVAGCDVIDIRPMLPNVQPTPAVAPAPMAAPVLTARERLVRAIEGQGCELNRTNVGAVLTDATISADELERLIPQLQAEGRVAVKDSGAIRVVSNNCI